MIDIKTETLISASQAARIPPPGRNGKQPHISFFIRKFQSGEIEAFRWGARWITSVEAIERWLARNTTQGVNPPSLSAPMTSTHRRSAEQASKALDAIGI